MDLIVANSLSKRFGGIVALDRVEFSARAGEVHALIGENGAGKSTFIQILSGALRHDEGTIFVDGEDYRPANPDAARARGMAAVFQELSLIPDLTVEQNIWFRQEPLTALRRVDRTDMRRKPTELLAKYDFPRLRPDQELRRLTRAARPIAENTNGRR